MTLPIITGISGYHIYCTVIYCSVHDFCEFIHAYKNTGVRPVLAKCRYHLLCHILSTYTKNVVTMVELNSLKSVWAFVFIFIHVDNLIKNSMSKYIWRAVQ